MDPAPQDNPRNRRTSRRRSPRTGIKVSVRAGTLGLGPDLAAGLVDVSEDGICVRLAAPLPARTEAEVTFERIGSNRPVRLVAEVRWCVSDPDGGHRAGLQFRHRIPFAQLMDLSRS